GNVHDSLPHRQLHSRCRRHHCSIRQKSSPRNHRRSFIVRSLRQSNRLLQTPAIFRPQLPSCQSRKLFSNGSSSGPLAREDPAADPSPCRRNALSGSRCDYADGCFRISAKACIRAESAGLFAVAALFSSDGAMPFNFASLPRLICELSALWIAFCRAAIRSAGKACDRDNWSTYAFATTNCAGHSIFCWFCTFSSDTRTVFAASISFCVRNLVGVSSKTSRPRAISEP